MFRPLAECATDMNGCFTGQYDNAGCKMMFTTQNGQQSRIYMLKCGNTYNPDSRNIGYGYGKVTIIIKNKGGKR